MLIGVGASTCASGSHVCSGTAGTFTRNPTIASTKNHRATCTGNPPPAIAAFTSPGSRIRSKLPIRIVASRVYRYVPTRTIRSAIEPTSVYRKNLIAAYSFRGPPQMPIRKYIGSSDNSKNT
jgi:hypothetical protein